MKSALGVGRAADGLLDELEPQRAWRWVFGGLCGRLSVIPLEDL